MSEANGRNGAKFIDATISVGQIGVIITIVASVLVFYFSGQTNVGERINKTESELGARINKLEGDMNSRMQSGLSTLADRVGKNETRIAVIEQHQIQEDASIVDQRTTLNSFVVDIRQQLGHIGEQIYDWRTSVQNRDGQGQSRSR